MDLAPFILLTIYSILCLGPLIRGAFDVPRHALMAVIGPLVFGLWWINGARIDVPYWAFLTTIGMVIWWLVTSTSAIQPRETWPLTVAYIGVVCFTMLGFGEVNLTGIKILMIGAVLNAVYGLIQAAFRYEPWKSSINATHWYAIGFVGNPNMYGYFMTVNLFLSLYLFRESPWWLLLTGLIAASIFYSKCRGAYVATAVGGAFLGLEMIEQEFGWYVLGIIGALIALIVIAAETKLMGEFAFQYTLRRKDTINQRKRYVKVAWTQFKKKPIFGLGFDGLKSRVPYIQRELNNKTKGKFMDPKEYSTPYPRKCHNDYIQMLTDVGIPGTVAYLGLVIGALLSPMDVVLKAALVSILVGGLFLHNWHTPPTNVYIWFLIFIGLRSYGEGGYLDTSPALMIVILILMLGMLNHTYKYVRSDIHLQRFFNKKDPHELDKSLYYNPSNGTSLVHRAAVKQQTGQPWLAIGDTMQGIVDFDGTIRLWELWNNAGKSYIMLGGAIVGEFCAREALSLNPHEMGSQQLAFDANNILTNGYKVIRSARVEKNESPINVSQHQRICPDPLDASNQTTDQYSLQTNFGGGGLGVS